MSRARLIKSQITNQQNILGAKVLGKILQSQSQRTGKRKGKGQQQQQQQQQLDPLLLATFSTATATATAAPNFNTGNSTTSPIRLNRYIYDFTLVYYRPRSTTTTTTASYSHNHDNETGNLKLHNGTQLEQVVPSLLDLFHNRGRPLFVVVDVARYPVADLLPLSDSKLEKWLEQQWSYKDRVISRNSHSFAGIVTS